MIGGGTGGLCVAQALHKAGVPVAVYERSGERTDRLQGYRIHINPQGATALHECLPPEQWQTFVTTSGTGGSTFAFVNEHLKDLLLIDNDAPHPDPTRAHHSASRITLHKLLSEGLTDILQVDKEFTHYTHSPDGPITCHFADGTTATADVLIGADGAGSKVRHQYLPQAHRVDTGIRAIAGKLPLTPETRSWLPPRMHQGPNNVLPPSGCGMFTAPHNLSDDHEGAAASYLMWSYAANSNKYPHTDTDLQTMDGATLRAVAARQITKWHPALRRMVETTPPETVTLLRIQTSVPTSRWQTTRITLLGDAIHSMTPFRGIGANTALRDAQLLSQNLITAAKTHGDPVKAIHDYETQMVAYGFAAVRLSRRTAKQTISNNRLGRIFFKAALKLFAAVPPLKRKAFADLGTA